MVTGAHNRTQFGYSEVVRIPAGASNLDIRQYGFKGMSKDDTYLGTPRRPGQGGAPVGVGPAAI